MESKLGLNFELVNRARASAAKIADDTQHFIDQHTTVTVERAVCRLLGIDGVNDMDVPLPNVVVDHLMANSLLPVGAAWASTCSEIFVILIVLDRIKYRRSSVRCCFGLAFVKE